MRTSNAAPRAFTLVELMVGLSLGLIVTAAAVAALGQATRFQGEVSARNAAARDGELVVDLLTRDLVFMGAGVPRGLRADTADFPAPVEAHQLRPLLRAAKPDHFVFVGDLPYPNAELNGVVHVLEVGPVLLPERDLVVTSELSGCAPPSASPLGYACATGTRSLLGPFTGGPPAANCSSAATGARTCPWALNKWQPSTNGVHLVVGTNVDGRWYEREWAPGAFADVDRFLAIRLQDESPDGTTWAAGGGGIPRNELLTPVGGAWAAHIDRVFWSLEGPAAGSTCTTPPDCVLRRRQCWGQVLDPGAADWPVVSDAAFRSDRTPLHCTAPDDGTPWETVMTGVQSFQVSYFDGAGAPLVAPWTAQKAAAVKTVDVDVVVARAAKGVGKTLQHRTKKRFFIENRGGLVAATPVPPASGGCGGGGDEGGCGDDG